MNNKLISEINELQDIIYNIDAMETVITKVNDVYNAMMTIQDTLSPKSVEIKEILLKVKKVNKICDEIDGDINKFMAEYGLTDGNVDDVEAECKKVLGMKLTEYFNSKSNSDNTKKYVDNYFRVYGYTNKTADLISHVKEWIEFLIKNPNYLME